MKKFIKCILTVILCFLVYRLIVVPSEIGTIDTTGETLILLTLLGIIVAVALFVWSLIKVNKGN